MSNVPILIVHHSDDLYDETKDYFSQMMVDFGNATPCILTKSFDLYLKPCLSNFALHRRTLLEWLPRVTSNTVKEAHQIMLDHYNIISYPYTTKPLRGLKGEQSQECRLALQAELQTHQPDICLMIGSRLASVAISGGSLSSSEETYGHTRTITYDDSKKTTKIFVIPCTKRKTSTQLKDMKRWFHEFLVFLEDEYD
ncbi:hypothetical protein MBANPS3_007714 [Mucor bainieri]